MIIILSPAKSLDYDTPPHVAAYSQPEQLDDAEPLVQTLRSRSPAELSSLMDISDALAALNAARYVQWSRPFTPGNAKPAVLAFDGDVYEGLDARTLSAAQLDWAQRHLRILSGLYGVLRPLDLMQPYRLEMGTRLATPRGRDLYAYWGPRIARALDEAAQGMRRPVLVNLASEEYFKAVDRRALALPVVQPVFQERKGAAWKVVSFLAKKARGRMARYAIEHRITDATKLKAFDLDGYAFDEASSDASTWVFRRG